MAVLNNPIQYLLANGWTVTSDPNKYYENYYNKTGKKPWGKRDHFEYGMNVDAYCGGYHRAYDLAKWHGAGIPAIADAIVAPGTGWNTFGWTLVMTFFDAKGKRYQVIYGHLDRNPLTYLKIGQKVKKGQIVAYQGRSNNLGANDMNSHLHIQFQNYGALNERRFTCDGINPLNIDVSKTGADKSPVKAKPAKPAAKPAAPAKPDKNETDAAVIIDVSQFQPPASINYDVLCENIDHAIVRTMDADYEDKSYKLHHKEFKARGIPTAAYAFVRGRNDREMLYEAELFYKRTKDLKPTFWWLDVETVTHSNMRHGVSLYLNKLRDLGAKKVGLYIAHHLYETLNLDVTEADAVWIPHYGSGSAKPDSKPNYAADIHQYTEHGRLPGYNGDLDLNRLLSDKPLAYYTDGAVSKIKPKNVVKETPKSETAKTYTIKPGDTLSEIAYNHGVSIERLRQLNNIANTDRIIAGAVLTIAGEIKNTTLGRQYTMKPGDALSVLAANNNLTLAQLLAANPQIKNPDRVQAGQIVNVPGKPAAYNRTHTVKAGETLSGIAAKYNTTVRALVLANGITNPDRVNAGDVLKLSGPAATGKIYHTVQPGESVSYLSNYYGVSEQQIVRFNNLKNKNMIYADQKLRIK